MGAEYENKGDFKEAKWPQKEEKEDSEPGEELPEEKTPELKFPDEEAEKKAEIEPLVSSPCCGCGISPKGEAGLTPEEYLGQDKESAPGAFEPGSFVIDNEIAGLLLATSDFMIKMQDRFIDKVAEGKKDWNKAHFHGEMEMKLRRRLNKHPFEEMDLIDIANYAMLIWNLRYNLTEEAPPTKEETLESLGDLDGHREFAAPNGDTEESE